jgi:arylsulfatase A-like enzyme
MRHFVIPLVIILAASLSHTSAASSPRPPNIVLILSDDVGYGDIGCYGATKVKTPHLDQLAAQGLRFTDAHCTSSTCTPSRYSLMTGQYAWRKKGTGVLPGDAPLAIDVNQPTMPSILRSAGYATASIGKWHLGLGSGSIDWNGDIRPGPNEIGFDYSFIIPATGDRVPCVFIENGRVAGGDPKDPILVSYKQKVGNEPTGRENPELLKVKPSNGHDQTIVNGISRIGWMSGGKFARWTDEQIADVLTDHAVKFIEQNKEKPFFLYFATHDIHVPRAPHARFAGTSQCGVRGDVIQELDWSVGEVIATLDRLKLSDNTLVIFSSDNGPVVDDGYADGAVKDLNGHTPAGPLRGGKYTIWEGGTRVPFIVWWPGRVKAGVSDALVSQIDFPVSFAALAGKTAPAGAAPDSENLLAALLGDSRTGREMLVEHSGGLALRKGNWKYIPGSGPKARRPVEPQLYNLADDVGETKNVLGEHSDLAREMGEILKKVRGTGDATPRP